MTWCFILSKIFNGEARTPQEAISYTDLFFLGGRGVAVVFTQAQQAEEEIHADFPGISELCQAAPRVGGSSSGSGPAAAGFGGCGPFRIAGGSGIDVQRHGDAFQVAVAKRGVRRAETDGFRAETKMTCDL